MTDGSQEFCLRWNNHQATIISVFDYLLENETLVDCTLAAEGQYLKAHKVVLCACSPYLELLLSQHNDKHPILIFKDIKYNELKCMIEYMYKGEVNIAQDQLNHFLKAAESLQIKGLSESEEDAAPQTSIPAPRPPPPRAPPVQRTQPRPISSSVAVESPKRINRNEAASPTRKRRRLPIQGRPSLSGDDASNASESHLDQSNCDVPSNVQPSSDNAVAKLETNSELILEPKTEYDDNSVEDITLDDDEEDYSQAGTSMDNSQMNFSGWQGMDKSGGDEVFTGQDSGAQNSQDKTPPKSLEDRLIGIERNQIAIMNQIGLLNSNFLGCISSIESKFELLFSSSTFDGDNAFDSDGHIKNTLSKLPLNSIKDFEESETLIEENGLYKKSLYQALLMCFEKNSKKRTIIRMMKKTLANETAVTFSLKGKRLKCAFIETNLYKLMYACLQKLFGQDVPDVDIHSVMQEWLCQAFNRMKKSVATRAESKKS